MHVNTAIVDEGKPNIVAHRFNETDLLEIEYEGRPVFLASQVGLMLGYADAKKLTNNLTDKWATDLVEGQDLIKLTNGKLASFKRSLNWYPERVPVATGSEVAASGQSPGRDLVDPRTPNLILLTESGAQLVAMLARTHQGRAFRRWLVDVVLPSWRQRHQPPAPPAPAAPAPAPRGRRPRALPAPAAEGQLALRPAPAATAIPAQLSETVEESLANAVRHGGEPAHSPTMRELLVGQVLSVVRAHTGRRAFVAALEELAGKAPPVTGTDDEEVIAMTQAIWLVRQAPDAKMTEARRVVGRVATSASTGDPWVTASVLTLMRRELMGLPDHALFDVLSYAARQRRVAGLPAPT